MRLFASVILLVAGCSATGSANLTVSPENIEQQAARVLQDEVGTDYVPELDCGSEQIDLVEGNTVNCVLTDPPTGEEYDTTVTISNVDGTNYRITAEVAETQN